jgi:protein TonB
MKKQATPPSPAWKKNTSLHFSVGLILSLTLVTMAFEWNFRNELTDAPIELDPTKVIDQPIMEPVVLPTPPRPKVPERITSVPDDTPLSTEQKQEQKPAPPIDQAQVPDIDDLLGNEQPIDPTPTVEHYDVIPAEPIGGMEAFYRYLYKNIHYPEHLKGRNITGKVFVSFEVDESGKISNVEILKGFDARLEKEIIRVLKNAPEWIPAQQGSQKLTTRHKIPFSFNIT